jgi:hypothetical protein
MHTNDICKTFKVKAFSYDGMKLKLFIQTLSSKVVTYIRFLSIGSKDTRKKLSQASCLITLYISKTSGARRTIAYFKNRPDASLLKCYVRYVTSPPHVTKN